MVSNMPTSENKFHRGSWLVTLSLVAIAVVHLVFVFYPGSKAISQLRREIEYRQHYIRDAANDSATLAIAQQELSSVKSYIKNWQQTASSVHRLPMLFGNINQLCNQTGTTTTRFEPQLINELDCIRKIPINMACRGTFARLHDFIRSLESLPQTIWIDSLHFEKAGKTGENILCEINLVIFSDNPNISNYADNSK